MAITGTMNVSRPAGHEQANGAVAQVHLYGPRGGFAGSIYIDAVDATHSIERLRKFGAGDPTLERLLNAAVAVLDSEAGIASMGELADAVLAAGGGDFTSNYPNLTGAN